jgi:hypothetical protein
VGENVVFVPFHNSFHYFTVILLIWAANTWIPGNTLKTHKINTGHWTSENINFCAYFCCLLVDSLFRVNESPEELPELAVGQLHCVGIFYAQTAGIIITASGGLI